MIEVHDLTVTYDGRDVLHKVTLTVPDGAHIALMGPSGCGKTTLLRVLAGLRAPDGGSVRVSPGRIACVFQEPRLLPWRTAAENVNAVLSDRTQTMPQARTWLERLELGAYVAFDTANLPNMVQWKMMKSHDYVLALEPCNTFGINRDEAAKEGKLAVLPAYSSVENHLELGVLDGLTEIRSFLRQL